MGFVLLFFGGLWCGFVGLVSLFLVLVDFWFFVVWGTFFQCVLMAVAGRFGINASYR